MKRIFAMVAIGISLLMLLAACGGSSSGDESSNQETPTAAPSETIESRFDIGALTGGLIAQGVTVGAGDDVTQPFFSVPGQTIIVNRESVQVFSYASAGAAKAQADLVDATRFTVGTTSISWMAPPHFYLKERLLVLYVGANGPVIDLLETVLGPQFAGADSSTVDPNSYADAEVQTYLALMNELTSWLRGFSSGRARSGPSIESLTTTTSKLEKYSVFFAELEGGQRDYVFETYGDEFRNSAENLASIATAIQETYGDEAIAQALARIPAFAIASVITSGTNDPVIGFSRQIETLLLPSEVAPLASGVELTTTYVDLRSMAANVDPAQIEHMDSFDSLTFATADGSRGLTLTTVKFDSEGAAADHLESVTSETPGLRDLSVKIGDASFISEVNESGVGSFLVFRKGEWVVTLHTAQPDGTTPLVDLAGVEALALIVAGRF